MTITIEYLAQLRRIVGTAAESIDCPQRTTLLDLLHLLCERHGTELANLLFDDAGLPRKTWLYFVADNQADFDTVLGEGDPVTILSPMAGGSPCHESWIDP